METVAEEDTDDDLPSVLDVPPSPAKEMAVEDFIWAKHKKRFWPAVVRKMEPRRVSVMFIDTVKYCFWVQKANAIPLNSERGNELMKQYEEEPESDNKRSLFQMLDLVSEYQHQKLSKKIELTPYKYFKKCSQFLSSSLNLDDDIDDEEIEQDLDSSKLLNDSSGEENATPLTEEINLKPDQERMEVLEGEAIIRRIQSKDCKAHLLKIFKNKLKSTRQKEFLEKVRPSARRKLLLKSGFGPISDQEQMQTISDFILAFFLKSCSRYKIKADPAYVYDVWIPEAIIWSISKEKQISVVEAEQFFLSKSAFKDMKM